MKVCDSYLSLAAGDVVAQQRGLGNRLHAARQQCALEWSPRIEAFLPNAEDLNALPDGSFLLRIEFTLARPFSSKAEDEFHPWQERIADKKKGKEWFEVQNPLVRDHLTGLPMVRPATWKGHLRFAAAATGLDEDIRGRLFGLTRGDAGGQAGRLHFFPTFFLCKTARDVVTPLWRETRTPARGPIDFEVIPSGKNGVFHLLYVPRPKGPGWRASQVPDDLEAAVRAVRAMLIEYGFSAKKTSGWGVAEDTYSGTLTAKGPSWPVTTDSEAPFVEPEQAFLKFMDENGAPKSPLKKASGELLSNQEYKASGSALGSLTEYKRFRSWYGSYGSIWMGKLKEKAKPAISLSAYTFSNAAQLSTLVEGLAAALRKACRV